MVPILLAVAVANLALGYALAVCLRWSMESADALAQLAREARSRHESLAPSLPEPDAEAHAESGGAQHMEAIPAALVDRLTAESITARSLVEATAQILRLEVGKYRQALLTLEDELRKANVTDESLGDVVQRLVKLNRAWLQTQGEALSCLSERIASLNAFAETGARIETTLRDQRSQIESICGNLESRPHDGDTAESRPRVLAELSCLVDLAHTLRDAVSDALLTTLRADDRLEDLDKQMRIDGASGLLTRAGYEISLSGWWQADPARHRLSSAALLDVVGCGAFNRQHGTRCGDRLVGGVGSLLNDLLRKERGFDLGARIEGQKYLFFFGDTGPRNATSAAERLRQFVAQSTFEQEATEVEITLTCAVTEVLKDDDIPSLIARLKTSLSAAKEAGRNRTMLDEGAGPQPVDPPAYQITGRIVQLDGL